MLQWAMLFSVCVSLCVSVCVSGLNLGAAETPKVELDHPDSIAVSPALKALIVGNEGSGTLSILGLPETASDPTSSDSPIPATLSFSRNSMPLGGSIHDLAINPAAAASDSDVLFVAVSKPSALLEVRVSASGEEVLNSIPLTAIPTRLAVSSSGRYLICSSMWSQTVTLIDLSKPNSSDHTGSEQSLRFPFPPREVLALPDDCFLILDGFGGELAVLDARAQPSADVSSLIRKQLYGHHIGSAFYDEKNDQVLISHQILSRSARTSHGDLHWGSLIQNVVTKVPRTALLSHDSDLQDAGAHVLVGTIGRGAADLSGLTVIENTIFVASSGTNTLIAASDADSASRRISTGVCPGQIIQTDTSHLAVVNRLDNTVQIFDTGLTKAVCTFGTAPSELSVLAKGERAFHDASLSHDGWMSCNSCHVHGHTPDLVADTMGDGHFGAPKRIPSLLGVAHTAPYGWTGNKQSLEDQLRQTLIFTMHGDALDLANPGVTAESRSEYLESNIAALTEWLQQLDMPQDHSAHTAGLPHEGRQVFESAGCQKCHQPDTHFTSPVRVSVGVEDEWGNQEFNPPSLKHLQLRRTFFHDGRFSDLGQLLAAHPAPPSVLTEQDQHLLKEYLTTSLAKDATDEDGWQLIFDGKTTKGWMTIKEEPLPASHVQDGALNPHPCNYMLVYEKPLTDFILKLDFKLSPKCNSGIFIRTSSLTPRPGRDVGYNGLEIALDDTTTSGFHDTGAIYDLVQPRKNAMRPAGEWNEAEIKVSGPEITIRINGEDVTEMNLDEWSVAGMRPDGTAHKFDTAWKDHPRRGYIGLQDHGSDCWYRNIRLKVLTSTD